jgi:DnaJ family protein C protein 28
MPNVEEHICKAMQEGKFDDLPGKGKPFSLEDNPYAAPEWQLAFRMLKEAGYSLPWIEELKEIDADIEQTRAALRQAWEWRQQTQGEKQLDPLITQEWERALKTFRDRVTAINKRIRDVNLEVPNPRFEHPMLNLEREFQRLQGNV